MKAILFIIVIIGGLFFCSDTKWSGSVYRAEDNFFIIQFPIFPRPDTNQIFFCFFRFSCFFRFFCFLHTIRFMSSISDFVFLYGIFQ